MPDQRRSAPPRHAPWGMLLGSLLSGCALSGPWSQHVAPLPAQLAPVAAELVPPDPDGALAVGDTLRYAIELHRGSDVRTWQLEVEVEQVERRDVLDRRVTPAFEDRVQPSAERRRRDEERARAFRERMRVENLSLRDLCRPQDVATLRVEAFGADGEREGIAHSSTLTALLQRGLQPACLAGWRQREVMAGRVEAGEQAAMLTLEDAAYDDVRAVGAGVEACRRFFRILKQNPVTRSILFEVVALPSLWSIVTNVGVRVTFEIDFFAAERVDPARFPEAGRELWRVPMAVLLNDEPAMLVQIVVGPAGAPDGAVAGVYAVHAHHPSDPERRVLVRLLTSRRASARPAAPSPR